MVGKHAGAVGLGGGLVQFAAKAFAKINIVAQNQAHGIGADKRGANQQGLCHACGLCLHGVAQRDAEAAAVAKQALVGGQVVGGGDDKHIADTGQHQHRQRIINHRFVVYRQQLFGHAAGERIQAAAAAAGQ